MNTDKLKPGQSYYFYTTTGGPFPFDIYEFKFTESIDYNYAHWGTVYKFDVIKQHKQMPEQTFELTWQGVKDCLFETRNEAEQHGLNKKLIWLNDRIKELSDERTKCKSNIKIFQL